MHILGQMVTWSIRTYDAAGALADTGTTPTAALTLPDGTSGGSATVTKTATGTYTVSATSTMAGRLRALVTATGANSTVSLPLALVADVWPTDPRYIISLETAKATLNLSTVAPSVEDELRLTIAAATPIVEDVTGPLLLATKTETRSGSGLIGLALWDNPEAISTVTEDGVALTAGTGYCVDEAGILWRGSRPGSRVWSPLAPRNVVVTYTVGESIIPSNVILAASELVKFLYGKSQQASRPAFGMTQGAEAPGTRAVGYTPSGFAVPNAVLELLRPTRRQMPGFA